MDLLKNNELRFVTQEKILAETLSKSLIAQSYSNWKKVKFSEASSLLTCLLDLHKKYRPKELTGILGPVKYIQFSYLRMRVLEKRSCCRIDLYDENWVLSNVTCSNFWEAKFAFGAITILRDVLQRDFSRQSYAPEYWLDNILLSSSDLFQSYFLSLLPQLLEILAENNEFLNSFGRNIKIFAGEYLDCFWEFSL